jgi:hypothetical protein
MFGQAPTVPGCGVIVADAGVPGGIQGGLGLRLGDEGIQLAQMRRAKAEDWHMERGLTNLPARQFCDCQGNAPPQNGGPCLGR